MSLLNREIHLFPDTVHTQMFEVSCNRQINIKNGIITVTFAWTIEPSDLPYSPLEALLNVDVIVNDADLRPDRSSTTKGGRFNIIQDEVGEKTKGFRDGNQTVSITLNEDASGTVVIRDILPSVEGSPNALRFDVSKGWATMYLSQVPSKI